MGHMENSKSLNCTSVMLAFDRAAGKPLVDGLKRLGYICGVFYIYGGVTVRLG